MTHLYSRIDEIGKKANSLSFYAELKRRSVFKVAIVYTLIAWVLLQVSDTLGPALRLPEWLTSAVAFLLILGFPIAVIFAWAFDLTPDGLKMEKNSEGNSSSEDTKGKVRNPVIAIALIVALSYLAFDKLVLDPGKEAAEMTADGLVTEQQAATVESAEVDKSIAVLPFVNMSSDKEQEYFSDGLAEELLNLLSKIPELKVAARTSSFSFKGKEIEITEIASRLKVAHVLEGSVRKSGNRIRITAQLVQADNGYHLWSETYDRQLDDIFQVQDEIATAVVDALKISLLGDAPKTRETDPQAYQLFLEGQYLRRQMTSDSLRAAIEAFKQAVSIDSTYVPAWANLADTYLWRGEDALADQAIQTAISADPDYAYTYYVRGVFRMFSEHRFNEGIEDFGHALRLDPDDASIIAGIGKGAFITGDFDLAIQQYQAALRVEPVVPEFYFYLGMAQRGAGRFGDAEASYRKMLSLSPQYRSGHSLLWEALFLKGNLDAALAESQQIPYSLARRVSQAITHFAMGNEEQSDSILVDLVEEVASAGDYSRLSQIYGYRGETDKAFEWLNQTVEFHGGHLIFILSDPAYRSLHSDPRWPLLLERINLLEFWLDMSPESGGPPE